MSVWTETNRIACGSCGSHILLTSLSSTYRCHVCSAEITVEKVDTVMKANFSSYWKAKFGNNKVQESRHPQQLMSDHRTNPMKIITSQHQPKKAVLVGVSYQNRKHRLEGTVNDVKRMKSLLLEHYHYPEDAICMLTEEANNMNLAPTKANIQSALRWLVEGCKSGDSLVFYFSGHGLRQPDFSGDEVDGYDETLCPSDFITAGMILDNDINNAIVKPLKKGVTLHAIVDACHSGTILDLEHIYSRKRQKWLDNRPPSGVSKSTSGGLAISLSACADNQMAADTSAFLGSEMTGALTFIFVEAAKANPVITYGALLDVMHHRMEEVNRGACRLTSFVKRVFRTKLLQDAQLSSSEKFNVDKVQFKL